MITNAKNEFNEISTNVVLTSPEVIKAIIHAIVPDITILNNSNPVNSFKIFGIEIYYPPPYFLLYIKLYFFNYFYKNIFQNY